MKKQNAAPPERPAGSPYGSGEISIIAPEAMTMKEPRDGHAYWRAKRAARPMPVPQDIKPTEIPGLLASILLIDVLPGVPADYYYRIHGDKVRTALGMRLMGSKLSELDAKLGSVRQDLLQLYGRVCESRAPVCIRTTLSRLAKAYYETETVFLPLSEDGTSVSRIFACVGTALRQDPA